MDEGTVKNGDITLHYITEGPQNGEPVLFLHGFPQFSYEWRHQLKALGAAGYRAVAPDLRGYNLSSRPEKVEDYAVPNLLGDVGAFYQAFRWSQANIVCHDWGGVLGWSFAMYQPTLVKKLVAIDIPHPTAFAEAMRTGIQQLQRSWYMWYFQFPGVAEQVFGGENIDRLINWVFVGNEPNTVGWNSDKQVFSAEDLATYKNMLSQPGQLTAGINWYRANIIPGNQTGPIAAPPPVQAPTLLIYGTNDHAFADSTWEASAKYCSGPFRTVALPGVGHWAPEEAPDEVNRLILEHLKE